MPGNTLRRSPGHYDRFTFFNLTPNPVDITVFQVAGGNPPPGPTALPVTIQPGDIWGLEAPGPNHTVHDFHVEAQELGGGHHIFHYSLPCNTIISIELGLDAVGNETALIDVDIHGHTRGDEPESG